MVNSLTAKCRNCMYLLRLLALNNLVNNRKIFVKYIWSGDNDLSDALSRLQFTGFNRLAPVTMDKFATNVSHLIWPASKIWQKMP